MRGYILIPHGGGATFVAQTNDTDHHQHVRRNFVDLQTELMIKKTRACGGGPGDLSREENIDIMCEVMSDARLHLIACKGYKLTGATNALDGTEDGMIKREAAHFWKEECVREKINAAVAAVEKKYDAGQLPWTFENVRSLIGEYPARGHLDRILPGQEDEATSDPEDHPWEDDDEHDGAAATSAAAPLPPDMTDLADWVVPPQEDKDGSEDESPCRGGGDIAESVEQPLSAHEAALCHDHRGRLETLGEAQRVLSLVGGTQGASLCLSVQRAIHDEHKRQQAFCVGSAAVAAAMVEAAALDERHFTRQRAEFRESCAEVKKKRAAENELKETEKQLTKMRKDAKKFDKAAEAREAVKSYSAKMLGGGAKKGGTKAHANARLEVMNRIRVISEISAPQRNEWSQFTSEWDSAMKAEHGENWGNVFAEIMQNIVNEVVDGGRIAALSQFMHKESLRVLGHVKKVVVPGSSP